MFYILSESVVAAVVVLIWRCIASRLPGITPPPQTDEVDIHEQSPYGGVSMTMKEGLTQKEMKATVAGTEGLFLRNELTELAPRSVNVPKTISYITEH